MGILNCVCICNEDYDLMVHRYKMTTIDVEFMVIIIQRNFRGFIARKNFKSYLHSLKNHIVYGIPFKEEWDFTSNMKFPFGFEYSLSNLNNIKNEINQFYKEFFTHNFNDEKNAIFTVKETFYNVISRQQFITNFKVLILNYLQETFDLGSKDKILANITIEYDKEESLGEKLLLIDKEGSSSNSTSLKNFTIQSNIESMVKEKDREIMRKHGHASSYHETPHFRKVEKKSGSEDQTSKSKEFKISLHSAFNPEIAESGLRSIKSLSKRIGSTTPMRSILLQKSIDKNNEYNRQATKGSLSSRRMPTRANTKGRYNMNNSNFFFSPRADSFSFTSLWGQNGKTSLENIIEEINKNLKREKSESITHRILNKEELTFYEGTLYGKQLVRFGVGVQYLIDKSKGLRYKYFGYFKDDKFHGYGIFTREDGYFYKGEFRFGKKCGYGIEITDKTSYKGFFHNDKPHGFGEMVYLQNKISYIGCFNCASREHIGMLEYEDGSRYIGHFLLNKMFSIGMFFWPAGHSYFGEWKDDKMSGKGRYKWKNGDLYFGGYENDLRHGEGEYFFAEKNSLLKGHWVNGRKHGKFKLFENGEVFHVNYRNDQQFML